MISSAGGSLLAQTATITGLDRALSTQLAPWRTGRARHDPGKVVLDLVVRAQPDLFGEVASDPTVSRLISTLAADAPAARATGRARVWQLREPVPEKGPVIIDLDATIVLAHSEQEGATLLRPRRGGRPVANGRSQAPRARRSPSTRRPVR